MPKSLEWSFAALQTGRNASNFGPLPAGRTDNHNRWKTSSSGGAVQQLIWVLPRIEFHVLWWTTKRQQRIRECPRAPISLYPRGNPVRRSSKKVRPCTHLLTKVVSSTSVHSRAVGPLLYQIKLVQPLLIIGGRMHDPARSLSSPGTRRPFPIY